MYAIRSYYVLAAQAIQVGDADVVVAGGMENMSMAPYYLEKGRFGYRMGPGKLEDLHQGLEAHPQGRRLPLLVLVGRAVVIGAVVRITSYNVCYTKLLRFMPKYAVRPGMPRQPR